MPRTEAELRDWVVEYNQNTTHDRSLSAAYGYNRILDTDLAAVCSELRKRFEPPIRVLDVGCGNGKALIQLAKRLEQLSIDLADFEFWGIGLNRYDDMFLGDDRLILDGVWEHDFQGQQFHLVCSVFAFQYLWHKLEALEKIHNQLLVDGGKAYLHFPGYLIRLGESPADLKQNEREGNLHFKEFVKRIEECGSICPMNFTTVPSFSDDGDCVLLAEFGHVRFVKEPDRIISFGQELRAFGFFDRGFAFEYMNDSQRMYVASNYGSLDRADNLFADHVFPSTAAKRGVWEHPEMSFKGSHRLPDGTYYHGPYRISSEPFQVGRREYELDIAIHEYDSERLVLICPGACESLEGRVVAYAELAEAIVQAGLGAVVRYNDPYDYECDYQEFLIAKTRCMIEFALETALHFSKAAPPRLEVMAYSSSAGAVAALAAEYEIETLLLIAPSHDLAYESILPTYRQFQGNVRVLVGEADQVVLPQHAFWYYENAENAATREYVEARCCDHGFKGATNKHLFFHAPLWAFGDTRPEDFPPQLTAPSEAWL